MSKPLQLQSRYFSLAPGFREKALQWASNYPCCSFLASNGISYPGEAFPDVLAISSGEPQQLGEAPFPKLYRLHQKKKNWLFGYFTYELKNRIHGLKSSKTPSVPFPSCAFFEAEILLFFHPQEVEIRCQAASPEKIYTSIRNRQLPQVPKLMKSVRLKQHMSREEYLNKVKTVQEHILNGDCYELNLCQEFSAAGMETDPTRLFFQLNQRSPSPFAAFLRMGHCYLLCASPERFLKKKGDLLLSQPIKGTIRRGNSPSEDEALKWQLKNDEKERAENMMIVDLVRNDLAISSVSGSVQVEEMFGIYSFRHLHQMISSVSSRLKPDLPFTEAIKNAFPMGSMTGAPKRKVMELIEKYENSARGLYSGAVGFIDPDGNFDFNVVIRSLLYDAEKKKLSFQVGGAITYDSVAEKEYEECLLKAKALLEVLGVKETGFS